MSEADIEGAALPSDGIDVDETSAYFGVTKTSELIMRLNTTDRLNGLGEFLTLTSDLLLTDSFDFDVVSERLECESGEIYYLLSGPFEIFTMTDGLRLYLGQEDSEGNQGSDPNIPEEEKNAINAFNDPFRLLKMFAVGHTIGGIKELDLYLAAFDEMVRDPDANRVRLIALHHQLDQVLNKAKNSLEVGGLSVLGTTNVAMKVIEAPDDLPKSAPPNDPVAVVETSSQLQETVTEEFSEISTPPVQDELAAAFSPSSEPTEYIQEESIDQQVSSTEDVLGSAFAAAETQALPTPNHNPPSSSSHSESSPPVLAPARAPIGSARSSSPSFGESSSPTFGSISQGQPTFGAAKPSTPVPSRPAGNGKVRGGGFPGIRSTIQTGVYCSSCGIGVEHHWRHCPVCSIRLI
ncbi:MAG: hypothetical protein VXW30_03000 [Candidatus Thermoplasmatota archaeon]|nr:hypothetical protein [Candidatus Thermoplasmatota archaeon]